MQGSPMLYDLLKLALTILGGWGAAWAQTRRKADKTDVTKLRRQFQRLAEVSSQFLELLLGALDDHNVLVHDLPEPEREKFQRWNSGIRHLARDYRAQMARIGRGDFDKDTPDSAGLD